MNTNIESLISSAFDKNEITDFYLCIGDYRNDKTIYEIEKHENKENIIFDLASLTKFLVCFNYLHKLEISLDSPLLNWFPSFSQFKSIKNIKLFDLMSHESRLKPWKNFWIKEIDRTFSSMSERHSHIENLFIRYKEEDLLNIQSGYCYSDLNYILLGIIIEKETNSSLSELINCENYFYLDDENSNKTNFVNYGYCSIRGCDIQGFVHDENCYSFGGVSGHAGLFATGNALKRELLKILNEHHKTLVECQNQYPQRLGLQFQDSDSLLFSKVSIGHLGFVGNDIWIDPSSGRYFILLSNRVRKRRISPFMKDFRQRIYYELSKEL